LGRARLFFLVPLLLLLAHEKQCGLAKYVGDGAKVDGGCDDVRSNHLR